MLQELISFTMTSVLLKTLSVTSLASIWCGSKSQKRALLSATHEIFLYLYLQNNRYGVNFLLHRESHLLPQTKCDCKLGPLNT